MYTRANGQPRALIVQKGEVERCRIIAAYLALARCAPGRRLMASIALRTGLFSAPWA
jgi:hypothetical protein